MRLVYRAYFFIFAAIFLTTCTNFNQDKMVTSSLHKGGLLDPAYLDSAASHLYFYNKLIADTAYQSPYGFGRRDVVLYPDSVYEQRLSAITTELPLVFNEKVKAYIELYAFRKKDLTERMLGKSAFYFPYMEQLLSDHGLPQEFKLLTMIESALRPDAESHRSAVGLWQIRYPTARSLGLAIDNYIDQRRDPFVSSEAGIRYLHKLYGMYGDWWLTVAAYNCGLGNLNKAIVKAGGTRNYWQVMKYLPRETRDYVPAFIAMIYLHHYQEEHNLRAELPRVSFHAIDTVTVYHESSLDEIGRSVGITAREMAFLNPHVLQDIIPARKEGITLYLPLEKIALFEKQRPELLEPQPIDQEVRLTARVIKGREPVVPQKEDLVQVIHRIKQGNTLDEISRSYNCSVQELMDWNGLHDPLLQVGGELRIYIPQEQAFAEQALTATTTASSGGLLGSSADVE